MTPRPGQLEVDIEPIKEAFLQTGIRPADLARTLGWFDNRGRPDGARVTRRLGIRPVSVNKGQGGKAMQTVQSTTYERAVQLVKAIGCNPSDVGL